MPRKKNIPTSIRIDPVLWDRIKVRAKEEDRTATAIIQRALLAYLESQP